MNPVDEIRRAVAQLFQAGEVVEIRVPKAGREKTVSGYFADFEKMVQSIARLEKTGYPGIYWTLNPVDPALLSRAENRTRAFASDTTKDADIVQRRRFPIDFDPKRPAGISSTNAEHEAALELARRVRADLLSEGWPEGILADSGNGAHLLYAIDLPNDAVSTELMKGCLCALGARYGSEAIDVDQTTYNASRIFKAYGTTARKGDSTEDRPHRASVLIEAPQSGSVSLELLQRLAESVRKRPPARPERSLPKRSSEPFDLEQFLIRHGIAYRPPVDFEGGGLKFVLEVCPWDQSHQAPDAAVFRGRSGRLGFKCFHNGCHSHSWSEFRELYEPGYKSAWRIEDTPWPVEVPGDARDEVTLSVPDVEAAVDDCITRDDVLGAVRLASDIAALRPVIRAVVITKLRLHFGTKWPAKEFNEALKDAAGEKQPPDESPAATNGHGGIGGPNLIPFPFTDAGNGERIVALWGSEIRYCVEMKKWLVWDGCRWLVDECNIMRQKGKLMARLLYAQAAGIADNKLSDAVEKFARASESYAAVTNALGYAATEGGVPIRISELDQQPYLLNCPNGVLDLLTGTLLPHERNFYLTKLCPVPFEPKAECPRFLAFLYWAMGANPNPDAECSENTIRLVGFVQRAFGSSLTASTKDQAVFVCFGGGKNGKTTLLDLFGRLLGDDYSGQLIIDSVMSRKTQDSLARADMADLRGVRFVKTSEVKKEDRLNEAGIKQMTGSGRIKAKRLYENPFEFDPVHKLWMDTNYRPIIRGVDEGIWRRLKLIPFAATIEDVDRDPDLIEKLTPELPGVLAWAVQGCMEWRQKGLGDPPEVSQASLEWREHDDPLKEFLEDCCEMGANYFVRCAELGEAYDWWSKGNREKFPLGREAFGERLISKGLKQIRPRLDEYGTKDPKGKTARVWEGIDINVETRSQMMRGRGGSGAWPENR